MRKVFYYLSIVVFVLSSLNAFGQENLLYERIQRAKADKVDFNVISAAFRQAPDEREILNHFENPGEVQFVLYENTVFGKLSEALSITLPFNNEHVHLELLEVPDSFYGYEVVTSDGQRLPASQDIRHYRGIVKDDMNSVVAMSFLENEVTGIVATDEGNFNLSLDRKSGKHVFFNDKNLKDKMGFHCGVTDDHAFHGYDPEVLAQASKHSISSGDACTRIYLETEHDVFQDRGSVTAVESYVAAIFNQVATLYQNENVEMGLSEIFIWTSPDPYTAVEANILLAQFRAHRTSFNGDLGQLVTFRGAGSDPSGWAAGFEGLCNADVSERLSVSMFNNHI